MDWEGVIRDKKWVLHRALGRRWKGGREPLGDLTCHKRSVVGF